MTQDVDDTPSFLSSLHLSPRKALFALAAGLVLSLAAIVFTPAERWPAGILLAFSLSWASVVDLARFILPDAITLGLVLVGLAMALASGETEAMMSAALGAAIGYGLLAGVAFLYRRIRRRDGLGLGDAKLLAAAGAWLGWAALPGTLLAASLAGLVFAGGLMLLRGRAVASQPLPFGPLISLAFFTAWLATA
jgi:leader peptidase (prepilin peptidase)/N-methyltransferase